MYTFLNMHGKKTQQSKADGILPKAKIIEVLDSIVNQIDDFINETSFKKF